MSGDQSAYGRTDDTATSPLAASSRSTSRIYEAKMGGWYDLSQLAQTAVQVLTSTLFGRHADHRLLEALAHDGEEIYDHTHHGQDVDSDQRHPNEGQASEEFWFDYVSDVGDGWDSTYAVAYYLAQPSLTVKDAEGRTPVTTRGAILVFGGDEVYPTLSPLAYDQRLVAPYETALRYTKPPQPYVYAIPGNHDWYDSLVAYTRLFCSKRWFAGWRTQQRRSDAHGNLALFPIGIRRVPRHWQPRPAGAQGPERVPNDPKPTAPGLVEGPIEVNRSQSPS